MVECLNCGERRERPECECPRCTYVGWAYVTDLNESLRKRLRERVLSDRRLRVAS
ncbi:MAG: hypothetical protein ACRDM1_05260 [Gaiellaceae bacterium]